MDLRFVPPPIATGCGFSSVFDYVADHGAVDDHARADAVRRAMAHRDEPAVVSVLGPGETTEARAATERGAWRGLCSCADERHVARAVDLAMRWADVFPDA